MTYIPDKAKSPPGSPGFSDPMKPEEQAPLERASQEAEAQDTERASRNMKPVLGFLPPLASRESTLTRTRKSKSRKAVLRGVDA